MDSLSSLVGGSLILIYFFIAIGIPILLIISPIMIWMNVRRCAIALERIATRLEEFQVRPKGQ